VLSRLQRCTVQPSKRPARLPFVCLVFPTYDSPSTPAFEELVSHLAAGGSLKMRINVILLRINCLELLTRITFETLSSALKRPSPYTHDASPTVLRLSFSARKVYRGSHPEAGCPQYAAPEPETGPCCSRSWNYCGTLLSAIAQPSRAHRTSFGT
jgi:hypothetical protein